MKKSKIFRPIVASSLALALSANVAVAEESISETIQGLSRGGGLVRAGEASFDSDQRLTGSAQGFQTLTFSDGKNLTFESTGLFLTENNSKAQVNHLVFNFTKDKPQGSQQGQNTVSTTGDTTTAKLFSDDTTQKGKTLKFSGGTNGVSIQKLEVQFNGGNNGAGYRTFDMDFSGVGSGKVAFTGDVTVSGSGYTGKGANNWTAFKGKFAGDFVGNITLDNKTGIKSNSQNLKAQLYNQLTFTGNASLKGNLTLKDGELHLSLANGTVDSIEILEDQNGGTRNPKLFLTITGNGSIGNINDQTKNPTQKTELDLQGSSTLSLQGNTTFGLLKFQGANTIDLSKRTAGASKAESTRRTLTINSLDTNSTGTSLTFISRVSKDGADKVIIDDKTGTGTQKYSMQVFVADNTAKKSEAAIIATVKKEKEGNNGIIDFGKTAEVKQGVLKASFNLTTIATDQQGIESASTKDYISYKLGRLSNDNQDGNGSTGDGNGSTGGGTGGGSTGGGNGSTGDGNGSTGGGTGGGSTGGETGGGSTGGGGTGGGNGGTGGGVQYIRQQEAEYAISTSTDLFIANFNSLNKRMGDLRDNANSQGVWARVFHGSQTNAFTTTKSKSKYATIQGGYDYGFALNNGAKTYLGLAFSYGHSSLSQSNTEIGKSDLIELALYNSYIENTGWYNDTIAKFSYLMNGINSNNVEFNNFAFLFSNEFGYRFKLGSNKEWFIDPQLELGVAYINGGEFKDQNVTTDVASMMILKNRLGSSFGYEFKNEKSTLKLYAGGFYEFDYFNSDVSKWSGNIIEESASGEVKNDLNGKLDHRFVLNLGTNAEIGENTRIYFDFETSFAGKITTDYKFNFGARYTFGQKTINTPKEANKTPIKLESNEQPKENKEIKEDKENKEIKASKENEENKVNKESEENKINKGNKGNKANKGSKGNKGSKANKGSKGNKVSKGNKTK